MFKSELGISLFQIAHSLIALERLFISRASEQFNKMSNELQVNWQNPILSSSLMSTLKKKERTKAKSDLKYWTVKIVGKKHQNAQFKQSVTIKLERQFLDMDLLNF